MKLNSDITINNRLYSKGTDIPWYMVYPFFLFHMLLFGGSGFYMAYADKGPSVFFLYLHGGIAILAYSVFYLAMFGRDEIKWMFINAVLGLFGIYTQIGWILALFGKHIDDYPAYVHVVPFLYFVLYTFLLRHALLDVLGARRHRHRQKKVELGYIAASLLIYGGTYLLSSTA